MKKILQNNRGETIVEVLVSFVLLLMFTAMFVVSLRYARAMAQKAETLRETAYAFCAQLYPANNKPTGWTPVAGKDNMTFDFRNFTGDGVSFRVDGVELDSVDTSAEVQTTTGGTTTKETQQHTFHRYSSAKTDAGEGGTP